MTYIKDDIRDLLDSICTIERPNETVSDVKCSIQGLSTEDILYHGLLGVNERISAIGYFAYDIYPNEGDIIIYANTRFKTVKTLKHYYGNQLIYVEARLSVIE